MTVMVSTDEQVRQGVLRELTFDARLQRNEIGLVHPWTEKQQAERAAWCAPGVASVEGRIVVSLSRL